MVEDPGEGRQAHELWCLLAITDCLQADDEELLFRLAKGFMDDNQ